MVYRLSVRVSSCFLSTSNYNKTQLTKWYDSLTSLNEQLGEQCLWDLQNFSDQVVACYSQPSSHVSEALRPLYPGTLGCGSPQNNLCPVHSQASLKF